MKPQRNHEPHITGNIPARLTEEASYRQYIPANDNPRRACDRLNVKAFTLSAFLCGIAVLAFTLAITSCVPQEVTKPVKLFIPSNVYDSATDTG